jgi:serine/threonine-protein kinase HipA
VWKWLPGHVDPVVAGRLDFIGEQQEFNYGQSYLARADAVPIYQEELPLVPGHQRPVDGLNLFSCIRDGAPDAWGRRVISVRKMGKGFEGDLDELTYLMESGSDRVGSLDFQASARTYVPRTEMPSTLDDLLRAAEIVSAGEVLPPELDRTIMHGTSLGGARPKAMIDSENAKYIAKFSASSDTYDVVKAEFIAMKLAKMAGLDVAEVALGKDVLLVKRFDRTPIEKGWTRHAMVSGLTVLGLDEMWAHEGSYADLADKLKQQGAAFKKCSEELFARMSFNILCGTTDDHARNHAFFVKKNGIVLTPAYDICPQARTGGEASHGMRISRSSNLSLISLCLDAAAGFNIRKEDAEEVISQQIATIVTSFNEVCDQAEAPEMTRRMLWKKAVLNEYIFTGEKRFNRMRGLPIPNL